VRAHVELGGLDAGEVTVQALHGPIDSTGSFVTIPATVTLRPTGHGAFGGAYAVGEAGPYGVTVRAVPHHADLINPMELGLIAWAV
jgi:glycogen phosphorylase